MFNLIKTQPVLLTTFVGALLVMLVEFGVPVTDGQQTAIQALIAAALAVFAASQVTSQATLEKAGTSMNEVSRIAKIDGVELRPEVTDANASPQARSFMGSASRGGRALGMIAILLAGVAAVACGPRNVNATPQATIAEYGTEVMKVTIAFQESVIAFAKANGGRTDETDRVMDAIDERVIPAAQRLSELLRAYDAVVDPELKEKRRVDVDEQITRLVEAYAMITNNVQAAQLANEAQTTSARVRELIAAVRLAIAQNMQRGRVDQLRRYKAVWS